MTVLKTKRIVSSLQSKGFAADERSHTHLILFVGGKKTNIWTKVSHGAREVDDHLIACMARQVKLKKPLFLDLVNCPMTTEGYLQELARQGITY
jgi:hypothetical protein